MKIIAAGCVGPGESKRYLKETLENLTRIADKVVILGDKPDKETRDMCIFFKGVTYYETEESLFNTKQWLLKQTLLSLIGNEDPDWIYMSDMDEIPDNRVNRETLEELANRGADSYEFAYVHNWTDREHIRVDKGWKGLSKVIFYKYQPDEQQTFPKRALHCGLVPKYAHRNSAVSGYIVKHLGYMTPKDRPKKVERYKTYDKKGFYKPNWWYESIKTDGDVVEFNEEEFIKSLPTD